MSPGRKPRSISGSAPPTLSRTGKYRKPLLFVLTLKYSGEAFRKVVWKCDQQIWARLHEEAFRALGGCVQYVVLDNLKQGVIKRDLYEPQLNPVYAAMLAHWAERWAAPRIHGRKKRQILAMYLEEKPFLRALPLEPARCFRQEKRTVDDAGLIPVDASHYAALPAAPHCECHGAHLRARDRDLQPCR